MEDGVVARISGHDIMPPFLLTKISDLFQEGVGKGEASAQVPTEIDPRVLTSTQDNTTLVLMNNHTTTINGKKYFHHKGVSSVVDQTVIEYMHIMALVQETQENVSVAKTQKVNVEMYDVGKENCIQKHGGISKGKGVVDVVVIGKVKKRAQGQHMIMN